MNGGFADTPEFDATEALSRHNRPPGIQSGDTIYLITFGYSIGK